MFIIILYRLPNYDDIHIKSLHGFPMVFGSRHSARLFAEKSKLGNHKIVEI